MMDSEAFLSVQYANHLCEPKAAKLRVQDNILNIHWKILLNCCHNDEKTP